MDKQPKNKIKIVAITILSILVILGLVFTTYIAIKKANYKKEIMEIRNNNDNFEERRTMQVFIVNEATEEEILKVREELEAINGVRITSRETKEDAYNKMKEKLADRPQLIEGISPEIFAESYTVSIPYKDREEIRSEIEKIKNIKKVQLENTIMDISGITPEELNNQLSNEGKRREEFESMSKIDQDNYLKNMFRNKIYRSMIDSFKD